MSKWTNQPQIRRACRIIERKPPGCEPGGSQMLFMRKKPFAAMAIAAIASNIYPGSRRPASVTPRGSL
jgi:hypothetical protein